MTDDSFYRRLTGVLWAAAAILLPLLFSGAIEFSALLAVPMQLGIILLFGLLIWQYRYGAYRWDRPLPKLLLIALPLTAVLGLIAIGYGFFAVFSTKAPSGEPFQHLSAYLKDGTCYAVFDRGTPVPMQIDFCRQFDRHLATTFGGGWSVFSALLCCAAWKRRSADV